MNDSTGDETSSQNERRARRFEQIVVTISVIITVSLLGYAAWQTVTAPGATTPQAYIEDTRSQPDGSVIATVALSNPQDSGLQQVTVKTTCLNRSVSVQFNYVPTMSIETTHVVCPPGTDRPTVTISDWIK
jgi:hypothetical protein